MFSVGKRASVRMRVCKLPGRCNIMSEKLDIAHAMANDLFKVGTMDEITMHKIDKQMKANGAKRLSYLINRLNHGWKTALLPTQVSWPLRSPP